VAGFLASDVSLRAIGLHYNGFGPQGAAALAKALRANHTVQELALYSNNIGPDGAVLLSAVLAVNSGVTSIDIGGNAIGDTGAAALAQALRRNTTITDLHLDFNEIGEDGGTALAGALSEPLDLASSGIANIGSEHNGRLHTGSNTMLTTLWLHGNAVGTVAQRRIDAALARNIKLVPRRLAAAYQRLALAALFIPAFGGPITPLKYGDKQQTKLIGPQSRELAARICQMGDAIATVYVSSRFEDEGWAWRSTQELAVDICGAALRVATGRSASDIRALLGTLVSSLTVELENLAKQKEVDVVEDMATDSAPCPSAEASTATRRKQRESATQETETNESAGPQHKKKKQKKKKQQKAAREEQSGAANDGTGSSLADLIATASLTAYQSQCPVRKHRVLSLSMQQR
jgi:hypothetical protein